MTFSTELKPSVENVTICYCIHHVENCNKKVTETAAVYRLLIQAYVYVSVYHICFSRCLWVIILTFMTMNLWWNQLQQPLVKERENNVKTQIWCTSSADLCSFTQRKKESGHIDVLTFWNFWRLMLLTIIFRLKLPMFSIVHQFQISKIWPSACHDSFLEGWDSKLRIQLEISVLVLCTIVPDFLE